MLGLVANSTKTAIILKDEFRKNHHEAENDFLDAIHATTQTGIQLSQTERTQFEKRLSSFVYSRRVDTGIGCFVAITQNPEGLDRSLSTEYLTPTCGSSQRMPLTSWIMNHSSQVHWSIAFDFTIILRAMGAEQFIQVGQL